MEVTCVWELKTPFKFGISDDSENPIEIDIETVRIIPLKTKDSDYYDLLKVEYKTFLANELNPTKKVWGIDDFDHFQNEITQIVGPIINRFFDSFYRVLSWSYFNLIFDGKDFILPYTLKIKEFDFLICLASAEWSNITIKKEAFEKIIEGSRKKDLSHTDIVKEFIRQAENFYYNGSFEVAIMHVSMASESFIKKYIRDRGVSKSCIARQYSNKEFNSSKPSFVEVYYDYALELSTGESLLREKPDCFNSLLLVNHLRNLIAHGNSMYDSKVLKDWGTRYKDMRDIVWVLIQDLIETINWVKSLS